MLPRLDRFLGAVEGPVGQLRLGNESVCVLCVVGSDVEASRSVLCLLSGQDEWESLPEEQVGPTGGLVSVSMFHDSNRHIIYLHVQCGLDQGPVEDNKGPKEPLSYDRVEQEAVQAILYAFMISHYVFVCNRPLFNPSPMLTSDKGRAFGQCGESTADGTYKAGSGPQAICL